MFEARLTQSQLLKKILDAIKDLVQNANFDCTTDGISLQVCYNEIIANDKFRDEEYVMTIY